MMDCSDRQAATYAVVNKVERRVLKRYQTSPGNVSVASCPTSKVVLKARQLIAKHEVKIGNQDTACGEVGLMQTAYSAAGGFISAVGGSISRYSIG